MQPSGEDFDGRYRSHYQRLVQGSAISETFLRHDPTAVDLADPDNTRHGEFGHGVSQSAAVDDDEIWEI